MSFNQRHIVSELWRRRENEILNQVGPATHGYSRAYLYQLIEMVNEYAEIQPTDDNTRDQIVNIRPPEFDNESLYYINGIKERQGGASTRFIRSQQCFVNYNFLDLFWDLFCFRHPPPPPPHFFTPPPPPPSYKLYVVILHITMEKMARAPGGVKNMSPLSWGGGQNRIDPYSVLAPPPPPSLVSLYFYAPQSGARAIFSIVMCNITTYNL